MIVTTVGIILIILIVIALWKFGVPMIAAGILLIFQWGANAIKLPVDSYEMSDGVMWVDNGRRTPILYDENLNLVFNRS
ncbi:MAG: hypothetical protein FWF05_04735 [Oscillospiraceae bacterium]|nr:hypothetical protein [Oscillospiraceae bacterium]